MLKKIGTSLFALAFFMTPVLAFAQDAEEAVPEGLGELISAMVAAAQGGQWSIFAALVIMILVYLATKIKFIDDLLPKAAKPWVAAIAGVLAAVGATAYATGDWLSAILGGLVTGAAASGLWELIGKQFLKKDAPAEEPPAEEPAADSSEEG